jgi:hypothetical protein
MSNQYSGAYCPRCGKQGIKIYGGEDLGQDVHVGYTVTCEDCSWVQQIALTDEPKEKKPKRSGGFEFL